MKVTWPEISPEHRQLLFMAGALSHVVKPSPYLPPVNGEAAKHYWDGATLARQGFINITDTAKARATIDAIKERMKHR